MAVAHMLIKYHIPEILQGLPLLIRTGITEQLQLFSSHVDKLRSSTPISTAAYGTKYSEVQKQISKKPQHFQSWRLNTINFNSLIIKFWFIFNLFLYIWNDQPWFSLFINLEIDFPCLTVERANQHFYMVTKLLVPWQKEPNFSVMFIKQFVIMQVIVK